MSLQPKREVRNLKVCPHGGINYTELRTIGLDPEKVIDFSVCSNPFMPAAGLKKILDTVAVEQYPDSEAIELRQRLSEKSRVPLDNILAGNGTTELIRLIALTYFRQEDRILILEPTYGEYEVACQIVGAKPVKQWMRAEDNFMPRIEETTNLIRQHHPKGIFICNPNNPTGKYVSRQEIEMVLGANEDALLILDEAYTNFVDNNWSATDLIRHGNVVVLRSMTKDYALAGLRLGYCIASQEIIGSLRRVCPPWNVNVIAQKAGVIALEDADYLEQSRRRLREVKQFLIDELYQLGFQTLPSDAHFFLVRVGSASSFRDTLLKTGILVRDCTSFGLPEYVRIGPRTMPECQRLITTIHELKQKGELDSGS